MAVLRLLAAMRINNIDISPTQRCNLRCRGCYALSYTREHEMTVEQMDALLSEAKSLGVKDIATCAECNSKRCIAIYEPRRVLEVVKKHNARESKTAAEKNHFVLDNSDIVPYHKRLDIFIGIRESALNDLSFRDETPFWGYCVIKQKQNSRTVEQ